MVGFVQFGGMFLGPMIQSMELILLLENVIMHIFMIDPIFSFTDECLFHSFP